MPVGRNHGRTNQAGDLAPFTSPWGQTLINALPQLIDQPAPIGWRKHNFGGTVGGLSTVAANTMPVFSHDGFFGDVPQSEQGLVDAPEPWNRV